jgi:hypothetical protein
LDKLLHYIIFKPNASCSELMIDNNQKHCEDIDSDEDFGECRDLLSMNETKICDVWALNFEEEMKKLLKLIEKYNVIAMVIPFIIIGYRVPWNSGHPLRS